MTPTEDAVDHAVSLWHDGAYPGSLHEWLGWSMEEYIAWVADPSAVPPRALACAIDGDEA